MGGVFTGGFGFQSYHVTKFLPLRPRPNGPKFSVVMVNFSNSNAFNEEVRPRTMKYTHNSDYDQEWSDS